MFHLLSLLILSSCSVAWSYLILRSYSGLSFFDRWDFYGSYDNLTLGDVVWLNRADAFSQGLAFVNSAGHAVIKVDDVHDVQSQQKRNSVRITTQDTYAVGSLWVADILHIPWGCSVWPAFWTKGPTWPENGEIDIIEGINLMDHNQMALHTTSGCIHSTPPNQRGQSGEVDCSQPSGCIVGETSPNSYQTGFAAAGGGVFATQFDVSGIYIWFWSRPNIPSSVTQSTSTSPIDISDWGPPSASYPSTTCNITQFFSPQNLVFDITLCGIWAGLPVTYLPQCGNAGPTGICYNDNVVGPGGRYSNAYFEINYVRAYTTGGAVPMPTGALVSHPTPTTSTTITTAPAGTALIPSPLFFPGSSNDVSNGRSMTMTKLAWWLGVGLALQNMLW